MVIFLLAGCSSNGIKEQAKIIIERSTRENSLPNWVSETKVNWMKDDKIFYKSQYSIRGDQRINACFDLAKAEAKEKLIDEVKTNFRSETNGYIQGAKEQDNIELNKMFISSVDSIISGFRLSETAYERFAISNSERIDCFVLYEMTAKDLSDLKTRILTRNSSVNKEIQKVIIERGVSFLTNNKSND